MPLDELRDPSEPNVVNYSENATAEVRRLYTVDNTLLGEGAFGKVFLAHSKTDNEAKYAIKILPVENMTEGTKT